MKIYQNICLPSFCLSCVWNWAYFTSFTEGPGGITITKVCVRIVLCERDSRGRDSRRPSLFHHFIPAGCFKHEAFTLHPTLLASTPHAHQRRHRKRERGRKRILRKPDCKQTGLLMLSAVTSQKVSVLLWRSFYELPLGRALNPNITHTCEPMSQIGDESRSTMTLVYQWHIWDSFFFLW